MLDLRATCLNARHRELTATDDVEVPPPSGPLALYRAELAGAFSQAPVRIVSVVDGAAVWIPGRR